MTTVWPSGVQAIWLLVDMSDSLCSNGCFISFDHFFSVFGCANSLHASILGTVVSTRGNQVPMVRLADNFAVFNDYGCRANMHDTIFVHRDLVNDHLLFNRHDLPFLD